MGAPWLMNGAQVAGVQLLGIVKAPRHFERHSHVTQWRPDWLAGAGGFAPAHLGLKPVGTESKRTVTLAGDQLRVSNRAPAAGGRSESVWKRGATVASR